MLMEARVILRRHSDYSRDQIAAAIIEGLYPEGEMLPSVRALAAEQGANPLTALHLYQLIYALHASAE